MHSCRRISGLNVHEIDRYLRSFIYIVPEMGNKNCPERDSRGNPYCQTILDSDLSATFRTTTLQHVATSFCGDTCAKTVSPCAVACVWLVGSFWHINCILYPIQSFFASPSTFCLQKVVNYLARFMDIHSMYRVIHMLLSVSFYLWKKESLDNVKCAENEHCGKLRV